jgi:nucleolar complex protein 3
MPVFSKQKRKIVEEAALETTSVSKKPHKHGNHNKSSSHAHSEPVNMIDHIAELSEAILEAPESAFTVLTLNNDAKNSEEGIIKEASRMRQLLKLAADKQDKYTSQLALLSLLAVFRDILPSYRIRLPSTKEMAVKVSKETKKLWDFERALLGSYQEYLKLLEAAWQREKNDPSSHAIAAILCLCELLKSAFHFNFRSNLITAVVRAMNHAVDEVNIACCNAIEFLFQNDAQGEVALEATRQVSKLIKDRNFKVRASVVRTLRALPLRVHVDEAQAAKLMAAQNVKKRKRDKESAEIEAEMKESQATVDKLQLARCQSDMLEAVTLTYFRILKSENLQAGHVEELLPAALEGLAKFAHLINIDTVMDLLEVLKSLLRNDDTLPLDAALNCILTAFQTLHGPGRELQIDPKEYIQPLYRQLPRLCSEKASRENASTMLHCLESAFIRRREFSTMRIAAFVKQICTVALHCPPHAAVPLLAFCRQLLQRYESSHQLLENEEDVIMSGQYNPNVDDPELCNAFATAAWELALLKFHHNPNTVSQAIGAASLKMLQLPAETPDKLRLQELNAADNLHIMFKRVRKRHPLEPREKEEDTDTKRRNRARFITPRTHEFEIN